MKKETNKAIEFTLTVCFVSIVLALTAKYIMWIL